MIKRLLKIGIKALSLGSLGLAVTLSTAQAKSLEQRDDVQKFINQMVSEHEFDKAQLDAWFSDTKIKQSIIDAMNRPAEKKPWHEYRKIFITNSRIKKGIEFYHQHKETLEYAEEVYGVPPEMITAIIGVETFYGRNQGSFRVMDALATLGFDYPKRSKFFSSELKHYLLMSREEKFDPMDLKGSYAGAMGMGQFIPSSFRHYAVDFDGDGKKDLWHNPVDAIGSVAHYFKRHGWRKGQAVTSSVSVNKPLKDSGLKPKEPVASWKAQGVVLSNKAISDDEKATLLVLDGKKSKEYWLGYKNFYVITRYNHSALYAMAVYQLSQEIKKGL